MQLEIEMKAKLADPQKTELQLQALGYVLERKYRKEDFYFRAANSQEVRVRLDAAQSLVTFKDKQIEGGLEINREHEFEISNAALMIELLGRLGCVEIVQKTKIGSAWRKDLLLAELSDIVGLGHYLEIECVLVVPDETSAAEQSRLGREIKIQIVGELAALGIGQSQIESRTYTAMLRELKSAL